MYIGPQGIVHGTTITVLNGFKIKPVPKGGLFVTSGLRWHEWRNPKQVTLQDASPFALR
jgi:urocanate hydratase